MFTKKELEIIRNAIQNRIAIGVTDRQKHIRLLEKVEKLIKETNHD